MQKFNKIVDSSRELLALEERMDHQILTTQISCTETIENLTKLNIITSESKRLVIPNIKRYMIEENENDLLKF